MANSTNNHIDLNWLEDDKSEILKYSLWTQTIEDIESFYKAKTAYLLNPCNETTYELKRTFLTAHCALKAEHSCHKFSEYTLEILTEILRKGV